MHVPTRFAVMAGMTPASTRYCAKVVNQEEKEERRDGTPLAATRHNLRKLVLQHNTWRPHASRPDVPEFLARLRSLMSASSV